MSIEKEQVTRDEIEKQLIKIYSQNSSKITEKDRVEIDGWVNVITGLGTKRDKSKYTNFGSADILSDETLARMWIGEGFGKRIVEAVADDMTREWVDIENDSENKIKDELKRLDAESKVNLAIKWQRLFRGALIFIGLNDGTIDLTEPVNPGRIKGINFLKVFDATEVFIDSNNYDTNPTSPTYGDLTTLQIQPNVGMPFTVHTSRVLIFKGTPVPSLLENSAHFQYWGMSILQPIWEGLKDFGAAQKATISILQELVISIYKFEGLAEMLATKKGEELLRKRMAVIDLAKSYIQAVMLDKNEEYERNTLSLTGLSDILDKFMMFLSGLAEIPVTRLFGFSTSGLNNKGEENLANYYDGVKSKQKNQLEPQLQKLIDYINVYTKISNPRIKFNPLLQLSEKEQLDCKKTQADIDHIYIQDGVLLPEEITTSRFENGYSYETELLENRESIMEEEATQKLEEMQLAMQAKSNNNLSETKNQLQNKEKQTKVGQKPTTKTKKETK